ncbi:hypothetical protein [Candidatus Nitrosocosmicus sp. R]
MVEGRTSNMGQVSKRGVNAESNYSPAYKIKLLQTGNSKYEKSRCF